MIIDISIENFLSIREKVVLSLEAESSRKISKNLIKINDDENLLKSIAIYGANASGKSNILKAINFMCLMVVNSHKHNVGDKINRIPFKLDSNSQKKPSKFEIKFIYENTKYKYGFSCNNDKIIDEYLYYWPKGREALIFKRENTINYSFNADKRKQEELKNKTLGNTLYISRATQLNYEATRKSYEFLKENMAVNYSLLWRDYTIKKIYEDSKFKSKIIEILKKADFGGIENIAVNKARGKVKKITFNKGNMFHRDLEEDFYNVKTLHKIKLENKKEAIVEFDINEESDGTKKTIALLGPVFDILEKGRTVFIDEMESGLHPEIAKLIIKLFNSSNNKHNAQLIFTTHNTNLLDNELFRKDQIYFTSKNPNKGTELYSLSDYNIRQDADFERAYLNGRVGGLPFIDETLFDKYGKKK